MRKLALLLLLAGIALPTFAAKRVTVEQLEQVLAAAHGKPDAAVARQLSEMELTERLSQTTLSHCEADLPGPETRQALEVLADVSAFIDLPAAQIPATATPDLAEQRRLMALTVDYVAKTISKLPNFFATRVTTRFEDTPQGYEKRQTVFIRYQRLHPIGRSSATVLYRDGREVVNSGEVKGKKPEVAPAGLNTWGEFGPILTTVLVDAAQGKLAWSHWEQSAAGPEAVFRYAVPGEKSHYEVQYCCVLNLHNENRVFQQLSGYHGEIAVDPANGTILRLLVMADLRLTDPIVKSDVLVEYGSVEIGGKTYICPVKSVSLTLARLLPAPQGTDSLGLLPVFAPRPPNVPEPLQTLLNDVVFERYHMFRADSQVLIGNNREPVEDPPVSGLANAGPSDAHPADAGNTGSPAAAGKPVEAAPVENTTVVAPAALGTAPAPAANRAPEPAVPEISVAEATGLPDTPAIPRPASPDTSFSLRVTARLVDVGVVAYDKKGHPVTDLKPQNFEIYDNGRKQAVRFFSRAGGASAEESAKALDQPAFSNRRATAADARPEIGGTEGNITLLLIDASNLAWADLTYAREEMMRFLRALPANERVGLYVLKAHGFQILEEGTADHALLAAKLSQWMPSAQDLTRAREEEQRNRQQFEEVRSLTDLQYVNGSSSSAPESSQPVDPQLRENGSNPGRDALSILVGVVRHLAALPGHKNLVWVTSDNVLANWTDKAVSGDKGSKYIDGLVLRAQEAMNDAHVAVYPLDASQLEGGNIDASIQHRNIELVPSSMDKAPTDPQPGRITAQMQQDIHPIQGAMQEMAEATGGRAFRRAGDIAAELNGVVADGRATYLLGFTPDAPADDQYHMLTVKLAGRHGVTLRYRTGYEYAREPSTLTDRFRQATWQPLDVSEIAVSANPVAASKGATLKLNIATHDLALKQQGERWVDKLDIFLVQRDDEGLHARVTGQTLSLALKLATYQRLLGEGIPFDQLVERKQNIGSVRIVVVDENSGWMGSVTVPAAVLQGKR